MSIVRTIPVDRSTRREIEYFVRYILLPYASNFRNARSGNQDLGRVVDGWWGQYSATRGIDKEL